MYRESSWIRILTALGVAFVHAWATVGEVEAPGEPLSAATAPPVRSKVRALAAEKISLEHGDMTDLADGDRFGAAVAPVGDLNADGIADVAIGAPGDDDGGTNDFEDRGALWFLYMDPDGGVLEKRKISPTRGAKKVDLAPGDGFGSALASLGDLNGDGFVELAVGAPGDDSGGMDRGAVYVVFTGNDARTREIRKIADGLGGFGEGRLADGDHFGSAVAALGDLDGDGITEIAVGAPGTETQWKKHAPGAVWILYLTKRGGVKRTRVLQPRRVGAAPDEGFGRSLAGIGDLDGDGTPDLAIGCPGRGARLETPGEVWIVFLTGGARMRSSVRIGAGSAGFQGALDPGDLFGASLGALGDLDANGTTELAVGAISDDDVGPGAGALWMLSLKPDGTVANEHKIRPGSGLLGGRLDPLDLFGSSVALLGDVDGLTRPEILVGAPGDDDGGVFSLAGYGAAWMIFLDDGTYPLAQTRNGSGANVPAYRSLTLPFIGQTWIAEVDASLHPNATLTLILGYSRPAQGRRTAYGELLVRTPGGGGGFLFRSVANSAGGVAVHAHRLPYDVSLVGAEAFTQAVIVGGGQPELTNAVDLRLGN